MLKYGLINNGRRALAYKLIRCKVANLETTTYPQELHFFNHFFNF